MTTEEVLQKVNEVCSERSYTKETLTDEFKTKFAGFFTKKHPDGSIDDETIVNDLRFSLSTAFSAASRGITAKVGEFSAKENEYKRQIEELTSKLTNAKEEQSKVFELPEDIKAKLEELEDFKNKAFREDKAKEILRLAKKNVREDLQKSFERYAEDFKVSLDKDSKAQAEELTARFQEIFKDTLGDIKPYAPKQSRERDAEILAALPKVTI